MIIIKGIFHVLINIFIKKNMTIGTTFSLIGIE